MAANMRYMFIECQTPEKAKLRNIRGSKSAARAHVTKEFHRKVRLKRQKTFTADTTDSSPPPSSRSPSEVEIKEEDNGDDVDDDEDLNLEEIPIQSRERSPSICDPVARSVIRSTLSQSRTDPFNSLAIQDMSPFLQRVLDHALVHTWPSTVPAKGSLTLANPVNSAWLQSSMQYPVVLHAFLYAASLHLSTLYKAQEMESTCWLRFDQYRRAIALVNKHIRELEGPPSDALIMAVTTLAVHGRIGEVSRPECHAQSPLATQQYIHVYGQILPEETHIQGLRMLLQRKGGIDKIKTYGMAETLALADTYFATTRLRKPELALYWPKDSLVLTGKYTPDSIAVATSSVVGSGFDFLRSSQTGMTLHEVFEILYELTIALDQYTRGGAGAPDMIDLLPARSAAQHQLLSLDFSEGEDDVVDRRTAEICRIAALIFSDMVVFPVPAAQQMKPLLAARLKILLQGLGVDAQQNVNAEVLLWATTLGCIASTFTTEHDWYLQQLKTRLSSLRIPDWFALQKLCFTCLWWPPVCDPPGRVVWREAQASVEMSRCMAYR